jgi:hypothetical protein
MDFLGMAELQIECQKINPYTECLVMLMRANDHSSMTSVGYEKRLHYQI